MKKIYKKLIVAAASLIGFSAIAQVSAYSFTQTSSSYSAITGGTVFGTATSDDQKFVNPAVPNGGTTNSGVGIPIGFNFVYNGITFDRFAINNNGWIALGQSTLTPNPVNVQATTSAYDFISTASTAPALLQNRIGALGNDLQGQTGSSLRVQVLGTTPNQTLVIQWANYRAYNETSDNLNFQIRLYETTNKIEFVYGVFTTATAGDAQIGLRGSSSSDFNDRNVVTPNIWSTSIVGASNADYVNFSSTLTPVSGQSYMWTPALICSGAPAANAALASPSVVCSGGSSNLSLANTPTVAGLTYQWSAATNSVGPYSAISGATLSSYAATNVTVTTWYQLVLTCPAGPASTTATPVAVNIANTTTNTVPYFEGFEGITLNNQLPNCSWSASDLPNVCQTYTITTGFDNQIAQSGSKFASFRYGTNTNGDYFYSNGIQLNAGTTYSASVGYITDGYSGWSNFSLLYGTSQSTTGLTAIVSATGALTNTTYSTIANLFTVPVSGIYYIAIKCIGNSSPDFLTWDNLSITAPPVCLGAPAANTIVTTSSLVCPGGSANLSLANTYTQTGIGYQWFSAASIGGPYTAILNATTTAYAITNLLVTTYYQAVITCTNGPSSTTISPIAVNVAGTTTNTAPYSEGFEGITSNDQLPNCSWSASSLGTICKTYTAATSSYNQFANTGNKFASFHYGTNSAGDYFYTNGIQLNAGTTYSASAFYIADGLSGWSQFSLLYGTSQSTTGLVPIASVGAITNTTYSLLANTFNVPTSGIYYIAVKAIGNSTPWYLTWDDLSITAVPSCTSASGGTLTANSLNACNGSTLSLSSVGATIGSGIVYQWQVANTPTGPFSNVTGGSGATSTSYTTAPLTTGTYYYVLQTTCTSASLTGVSNQATVTINPVPTASASANGPLCSGQILNLTGNTNIGTTFMWTGPNTYSSNTQSPSITNVPANASGVYTLMVSTPNCTSTPATVSVNINATPTTITVTPSSSQICGSGSTTLAATGGLIPATFAFGTQANQNTASTAAAGYPGPYSAYYGGQKMQVLVLSSELSAAGFVANSPINSIQFPVVSFGSNWGSSITNNQSFQVNAGLTTVSNLTAFLTGLTNVAPATNFTPTVGYNNTHNFATPLIWDGTSNVVIETTFSNNFFGGTGDLVVSYNSPTTFTGAIVYRADSQTPAAMAAATGISYSYLSRPDFKLNGLAISTYSWNPAATLSSATGASVVATPTSSTIYTISVANGSCSVNGNATVSVTPVPSVSIVASNTAVCIGGAATFTASGASTYSWNTTATTSTISVTPTVPTTYTVTGANGTCTSIATTSIGVNALPTVSLGVSNGTLCTTATGGSTVALTGSPTGGAYAGTNVAGNVFTPATSGTFTPSYSFTNSTTGCAGTATTSIIVSACTGINNITSNLVGLQVYPNPNNGEFTVELINGSVKTIQVLDITGRIVLSDVSANDKMNFNISNLANGVYYVKIQSNNTVDVLKIVKQ